MLDTNLAKKLRKIQILAERSTGAEQEEAARQLQKLLTRHNLSITDIGPLDNEGQPKPAFAKLVVDNVPNQGWLRILIHGLAQANHGTTVGTGYRGRWGCTGKKSCDLIMPEKIINETLQLFHYWKAEIEYLAKQHQKIVKNNAEYLWYPRIYMNSYRTGLAEGIVSVVKEAAKKETETMTQEASATRALVLDLTTERDNYVSNVYGRLTYGKTSRQTSNLAYRSGYTTGREQSTNIHQRVK